MSARIESPWAKVPIDLLQHPGVTLADVQVYVHIDYAAGKRGYWDGTQREIAEATGVTDRTVRTAITRLEQFDYITTQRLGFANRTVLRYWVLARSRPLEEAFHDAAEPVEAVADETPEIPIRSAERPEEDFRSLGSEFPLTRIGISAATTSNKDLYTDQREREIARADCELSPEQASTAKYLRTRMRDDLCGGSDAPRDAAFGEQLIRKGATRADIDAAIAQAKARGISTMRRGGPFVLACIEGAVQGREAGYDRGAATSGARRVGAVRGPGAGARTGGAAGGRRADGRGGVSTAARPRRAPDVLPEHAAAIASERPAR